MRSFILLSAILCTIHGHPEGEVRLLDLDPTDAEHIIEQQDQSLNYAPKIETNVPAVRFIGKNPQHVLEDIYLARQYHGQDGLGGYLYGYNIPDIAKTEKKKAGGDLRGAYNYITGNGEEIKVEYWDDGTGFHQVDNVPLILPKQVDDSPDVKAAKEKFFARWHEEAERNTHPLNNPYNDEGNYDNGESDDRQQQFKQYQHPGQYQLQQEKDQNRVDYTGQYSEQKNVYSQFRKPEEQPQIDEETTGPPRGFFYKFDYPVGIIVQKEGDVKDNLKDIYSSNKANYEGQLQHGNPAASSSQTGYLYVKN